MRITATMRSYDTTTQSDRCPLWKLVRSMTLILLLGDTLVSELWAAPPPATPASHQGPTEQDLTKLIDRLIELDSIDLAPLVRFRAGLEPSLHSFEADETGMTVLKDPYAR